MLKKIMVAALVLVAAPTLVMAEAAGVESLAARKAQALWVKTHQAELNAAAPAKQTTEAARPAEESPSQPQVIPNRRLEGRK